MGSTYRLSVDALPPGGGRCCISACRAEGELTAGWPAAPASESRPPAMDTGGIPGSPASPGGRPTGGGPPMPGGMPGSPLDAAACCWKTKSCDKII